MKVQKFFENVLDQSEEERLVTRKKRLQSRIINLKKKLDKSPNQVHIKGSINMCTNFIDSINQKLAKLKNSK